MPKLIIDNRKIEVEPGTKVIDAAERLGIMIPRFCFHPALGSVGACRVCAVKFLQGPFQGVQMSCMIDAQDDMVVSTDDEEALDFRKHVIEWLMLHHPHDCPVCDEGGHCLLQDMTVSGGHGMRRYLGPKRTHNDQYLGPLIQHEMNRCIQCYRCTRYYREFSGYPDLGVMGIGNRVYFGRYREGTLQSPFAGNLIDICPTGVYTDRPSRFTGRRWDFERTPSICIHCCLGCHTITSTRYREVVRQEARYSPDVNGYFICDRGRYGFNYVNLPDRPRSARVDGRPVGIDSALQAASDRLAGIEQAAGVAAIACIGSARSSLETLAMQCRLCQSRNWRGPIFWTDPDLARSSRTAVLRLHEELAVSMSDLEKADYLVVIGADPLNEAPMAALALRQARRNGAHVVVIDPRPVDLPFDFEHLPLAPGYLPSALGVLLKKSINRSAVEQLGDQAVRFYERIPDHPVPGLDRLVEIAAEITDKNHPVIVCGTQIVNSDTAALAADFALLLRDSNRAAGLFYLLPGANAFSAALLSETDDTFEGLLADIEKSKIKALLVVESNPWSDFADVRRLEAALDRLELLIVCDYLESPVLPKAHISLPTATVFDAGGIFVNQHGRAQHAPPVFHGGLPIRQISKGDHPPRKFRDDVPQGDLPAGWQSLSALLGVADSGGIDKASLQWIKSVHPALSELPPLSQFGMTGVRLQVAEGKSEPFTSIIAPRSAISEDSESPLKLMLVDWTFGTEELSARSTHLAEREDAPFAAIHTQDARRCGISDGDTVEIHMNEASMKIRIRVKENMAAGLLVLPRHHSVDWRTLQKEMPSIPVDCIRKANGENNR